MFFTSVRVKLCDTMSRSVGRGNENPKRTIPPAHSGGSMKRETVHRTGEKNEERSSDHNGKRTTGSAKSVVFILCEVGKPTFSFVV